MTGLYGGLSRPNVTMLRSIIAIEFGLVISYALHILEGTGSSVRACACSDQTA